MTAGSTSLGDAFSSGAQRTEELRERQFERCGEQRHVLVLRRDVTGFPVSDRRLMDTHKRSQLILCKAANITPVTNSVPEWQLGVRSCPHVDG